tara:strand:- start:11659 stop:13704 length:2046 start_codon:yes stop_codon:yes gene_type:complete
MFNNLKINIINNLTFLAFLIISFYLGYTSKNLIDWNYDIYYLYSQLIVFFSAVLLVINIFLRHYSFNKYVQLLGISFISSFSIAVILIIIQDDLIHTRWLELGLFAKDDAKDYMQQVVEYLFNGSFYSPKGRVMFPILYSGFIGVFKLNTHIIQIIITFLTVFVTFYSAILIHNKYGYIYAIIFSAFASDFLHEHVGGVCTENIGYILGGTAFIFFINFINTKNKNLYIFSFAIFLLLIGFIIRPSIIFIIPAICLWSFIYVFKYSKVKAVGLVVSCLLLFVMVIQVNNFVIEKKSPDTPKEFSNAYDSWYATAELGKYFLEDNYDELPPQLWSKIIKDHPYLKELSGTEAAKQKKNILYDSLKENPENFIVGSMMQMIKFFEVSGSFEERYHNTAGFLHIEFYLFRIFILFLFALGGIVSIYKFIRYKNYELSLFGLLFLAVILSQPFLFGGEARTAATVLLFLNYILVYGLYNLIEYIKSKKDAKYIFKDFQLKNNNNKTNVFIYCIPLLALSFFLYKGLNNNFDYLTNVKVGDSVTCPEGYNLKNIVFNDKGGFYINDSKSDKKNYQKDFSDVLDNYSDIIVLSSQLGIPVKIDMPIEEVKNRDTFKVLQFLVAFTDHRLFHLYTKEQKLLKVIGNVYLLGGGFFINPINKKTKSLDSLLILKEDMLEKGFNDINICL